MELCVSDIKIKLCGVAIVIKANPKSRIIHE